MPSGGRIALRRPSPPPTVAGWLLITLIGAGACGGSGPSAPETPEPPLPPPAPETAEPPPPPPTSAGGVLAVTLQRAPGAPALLFSARIAVGNQMATARDSESALFQLPAGVHQTRATVMTPGCQLQGEDTRSVTVTTGAQTDLILSVLCTFDPIERLLYQFERLEGTDFRIDLKTVRVDGADERDITNDGQSNQFPSWSADGTRIAWHSARARGVKIWIMNHDGSEMRSLTEDSFFASYPSWSPDGTQIVFHGNSSTGGEEPLEHDLWIMGADGSGRRRLTSGVTDDREPRWSPDGTTILFARDKELHRIGPDGRNFQALLVPGVTPRWSPDGSRIVYVAPDLQVWTASANGSNARRLITMPDATGAPEYSPDGMEIIFHSPRTGNPLAWIIDADGSNVRRLPAVPIVGAAHLNWVRPAALGSSVIQTR